MDSDLSPSYGFAFNNDNFSDRLLRIEITRGSGEVKSSSTVGSVRDRKRRREDVNNKTNVATSLVEFDLNKNLSETNCESNNKNSKHEEALVMAGQEPQSGGEDENEHDHCGLTNQLSVVSVRELHISSAILAGKSPYFYKLFSNGMLESVQKHTTLKIDASEESAVMELLNFMYSNSVSVTTAPALVDVLVVADKFEVASCMKYCSRLLLKMPMTLDSALLLLDLPSSLLAADSVKPLPNAARQFIASRYKSIHKVPMEELMALPLVGIEAIIASDSLEVSCEDIAYDFVLRWANKHYTVLEERQEILGSHLARYIRFPHMSCGRLKAILTSDDFKPSVAIKLVLAALLFKAESLDYQRVLALQQPRSFNHWFAKRAYIYKPIKIVEFEAPRRQCIVYLDLKRKECESIYPSGHITSEVFSFGRQGFFISASWVRDHLSVFHYFGLFIGMQEEGFSNVTVDCEFSVRSKPTEEFERRFKGVCQFYRGKTSGCRNLVALPWKRFLDKNCPYFIDDVLHLRVDISIRH